YRLRHLKTFMSPLAAPDSLLTKGRPKWREEKSRKRKSREVFSHLSSPYLTRSEDDASTSVPSVPKSSAAPTLYVGPTLYTSSTLYAAPTLYDAPKNSQPFDFDTRSMPADTGKYLPKGYLAKEPPGPKALSFPPTAVSRGIQDVDSKSAYPQIFVTCSKGFFQVNLDTDIGSKWICYQQHYMNVEASFSFGIENIDALYIQTENSRQEKISHFRLSLSAVTDTGDAVGLVQHTPGRDKGLVRDPEPCVVKPMTKDQSLPPHPSTTEHSNSATTSSDAGREPFVAAFDQVQFKAATANNRIGRGHKQQYFHLVVSLIAETSRPAEPPILVATRKSDPIMVQGRSPGHYSYDQGSSSHEMLSSPQKLEWVEAKDSRSLGVSASLPKAEPPGAVSDPSSTSQGPLTTLRDDVSPYIPASVSENEGLPDRSTKLVENSSISSMAFSSRQYFSSKPSLALHGDTTYQIVELFLEDRGLWALCTDGFNYLDADRFERNFRLLLKIFLKTIRQNQSFRLHGVRIQNGDRRVKELTAALRNSLRTSRNGLLQQWTELASREVDRRKMVDKYRSEIPTLYNPESIIDEVADVAPKSSSTQGSESESNGSDHPSDGLVTEKSPQSLRGIKELILGTDAWEDLKKGLIAYTVPIIVGMLEARYQTRVAEQESSYGVTLAREVPVAEALLTSIRHANASCEVLKIAAFSRSLKDFERRIRTDEFDMRRVEKEAFSVMATARGLLSDVEAEIWHAYTRYFQERYQQSFEQTSTEVVNPSDTRARPTVESHNLTDDHAIPIFHRIDLTCFQGSLNSIDKLTEQLPIEQLHGLAASVQVSQPLGLISSDERARFWTWEEATNFTLDLMNRLISFILPRVEEKLKLIGRWWRNLRRPSLASGHQRVEWLCDCGDLLWGDFRTSESAQNLAQWLECPNQGHSGHPTNSLTMTPPISSAVQATGHMQNIAFPNSQTSSNAHPGTTMMSGSIPCPPAVVERYLELCVNTGEHSISLAEIQVTTPESSITSDGQLFEEIRKQYRKRRGFLQASEWSLFKPIEVHFVQFCLEDGDVGILKTPLSLPAEKDILQSREWEYCPCPCPLKEPPPIPTNVFLHHFNSTRTHPRNTWLNRLPKKLNHSIHHHYEPPHVGWQALGWGIHIIEGPNGKAFLVLNIALVSVSLVVALTWSVLKGDVQGGFAIAGFAIAAVSALLFAVFNYHSLGRMGR
ncbi:MAG: hypothetical protein Q9166_007039, partial [cf. Caloplaca sp. 2 TL-2023]